MESRPAPWKMKRNRTNMTGENRKSSRCISHSKSIVLWKFFSNICMHWCTGSHVNHAYDWVMVSMAWKTMLGKVWYQKDPDPGRAWQLPQTVSVPSCLRGSSRGNSFHPVAWALASGVTNHPGESFFPLTDFRPFQSFSPKPSAFPSFTFLSSDGISGPRGPVHVPPAPLLFLMSLLHLFAKYFHN